VNVHDMISDSSLFVSVVWHYCHCQHIICIFGYSSFRTSAAKQYKNWSQTHTHSRSNAQTKTEHIL